MYDCCRPYHRLFFRISWLAQRMAPWRVRISCFPPIQASTILFQPSSRLSPYPIILLGLLNGHNKSLPTTSTSTVTSPFAPPPFTSPDSPIRGDSPNISSASRMFLALASRIVTLKHTPSTSNDHAIKHQCVQSSLLHSFFVFHPLILLRVRNCMWFQGNFVSRKFW